MPTVRTAIGKMMHLPYTKKGEAKAASIARRSNGGMMRIARRRKQGTR